MFEIHLFKRELDEINNKPTKKEKHTSKPSLKDLKLLLINLDLFSIKLISKDTKKVEKHLMKKDLDYFYSARYHNNELVVLTHYAYVKNKKSYKTIVTQDFPDDLNIELEIPLDFKITNDDFILSQIEPYKNIGFGLSESEACKKLEEILYLNSKELATRVDWYMDTIKKITLDKTLRF